MPPAATRCPDRRLSGPGIFCFTRAPSVEPPLVQVLSRRPWPFLLPLFTKVPGWLELSEVRGTYSGSFAQPNQLHTWISCELGRSRRRRSFNALRTTGVERLRQPPTSGLPAGEAMPVKQFAFQVRHEALEMVGLTHVGGPIGVRRSDSVAENARVAVTKPQALNRGSFRTVTFYLQNALFSE